MIAAAPPPAALVRRIRALHERKMREKYGQFLAEGARLVEDLARSGWMIEVICAVPTEVPRFEELTRAHSIPFSVIDESAFAELSVTDSPQGVLAVVRKPAVRDAASLLAGAAWPVIVALDAVADPGNAGTIVRTAAWFGAAGLLCGAGSVELFNPKVVRSTMGAIAHLPFVEGLDLAATLTRLRNAGVRVLGTALDASPVRVEDVTLPAVVVIGSEAHGLSPAVAAACDALVAIPRYGVAQSLNAAVALGVLLGTLRGVGRDQ